MEKQRRNALKRLLAVAGGLLGGRVLVRAAGNGNEVAGGHEARTGETVHGSYQQVVPLFSMNTKYNGLVFIAGIGAHFEGDIKSHTDHVLKELEKELIAAGSSMEKVLKVTVFLNDIEDYKGMNEVYQGRFGKKPPVRTTVAVAKGGVPGNSLVEMDAIAYA